MRNVLSRIAEHPINRIEELLSSDTCGSSNFLTSLVRTIGILS